MTRAIESLLDLPTKQRKQVAEVLALLSDGAITHAQYETNPQMVLTATQRTISTLTKRTK